MQLSPSSKARLVELYGTDWPPKRPREDYFKEPVFSRYRDYLKSQADAQDKGLENLASLCFRFQRCPDMDELNCLIQEANIINEKHRLNFPVYFFMQEFKFKMYIADETEQPSLFVGTLPHYGGQMEVWAHWPKSKGDSNAEQNNTAVKTVLYNTPNTEGSEDSEDSKDGEDNEDNEYIEDNADSEDKKELVCEIQPDWRKHIQWDEPLEQLFQLSKLTNRKLRSTVVVQNAILLSVAKVVIRFPGLMKLTTEQEGKPDYIKATRVPVDLSRAWSRRYARRRFPKAYDILNSGPDLTKGVHRGQPPRHNRG